MLVATLRTLPKCHLAILKRGPSGRFDSASERHLQRYADELDFRWNNRQSLGYDDVQRADIALKQIAGKRLTYGRTSDGKEANV